MSFCKIIGFTKRIYHFYKIIGFTKQQPQPQPRPRSRYTRYSTVPHHPPAPMCSIGKQTPSIRGFGPHLLGSLCKQSVHGEQKKPGEQWKCLSHTGGCGHNPSMLRSGVQRLLRMHTPPFEGLTPKASLPSSTKQVPDCNLRQGAGGMKFARNGSRTCFLR